MNILIDLAHPADVHSFQNAAKLLISKGHKVLFTTSDRPMIQELLQFYKLEYKVRGKRGKNLFSKVFNLFASTKNIFFISLKFKPDLFFDRGTIVAAIVAKILRKPYIVIGDSESGKNLIKIIKPLADSILTGESFQINIGEKHIRFNGNMELLYLYPTRFKPDSSIRNVLNLREAEKYIILRFVAWDAYHDVGESGIPLNEKIKFIDHLSKHAKVFITSESELPEELKKYEFKIPFYRMLDALAFAEMYVGEGATMAAECAVLGTPAIYINSIELGYCKELEEEYDLMYHFKNVDGALDKADELIKIPNLKEKWKIKQKKMLDEKIDVTEFLSWYLENYPQSDKIVKENSNYQYSFR